MRFEPVGQCSRGSSRSTCRPGNFAQFVRRHSCRCPRGLRRRNAFWIEYQAHERAHEPVQVAAGNSMHEFEGTTVRRQDKHILILSLEFREKRNNYYHVPENPTVPYSGSEGPVLNPQGNPKSEKEPRKESQSTQGGTSCHGFCGCRSAGLEASGRPPGALRFGV